MGKKKVIQNKNIQKAKWIYRYLIFAGIFMFLAVVGKVFIKQINWVVPFIPIIGLVVYFMFLVLKKNIKTMYLYIKNVDQGMFLLFLNENADWWSDDHRQKVVQYVYPKRRHIRVETKLELVQKYKTGNPLSKEERRRLSYENIYLPQQVKDGFNEAILINALIYAHVNIKLLDQELLDIMQLTDERMAAFDLQKEIEKCKTKKDV